MSELKLSVPELDYLLSARAVRDRAQTLFEHTVNKQTSFLHHPEKLASTTSYVLEVIHRNYPTLDIPFHSRWGHFRAGNVDRVAQLEQRVRTSDPMEKARSKIDLVVTSVLLDAGAGPRWAYRENNVPFARSEGLGIASFHMFLSGVMSADRASLRADGDGLARLTVEDLNRHFQVSAQNPLVGVEGRLLLLNNLAKALQNKEFFCDGRPGSLLDYLFQRYGQSVPATKVLRAVLDSLGPIWPGRLTANGVNLGDVWRHSKLAAANSAKSLVPLHKLSQWLTYSLIEPIEEAGLSVTGIEDLTGLAEYRNGGLFIDSGLLSLKNPEDAQKSWAQDSDLVIEWRALTIYLLDLLGTKVQAALGKTPREFPLAKVLEGGTWWAGRFLAQEKRAGGGPPLNVVTDGTVF